MICTIDLKKIFLKNRIGDKNAKESISDNSNI